MIGTKSGGASALPNSSGVLIQASASDNTIGGTTAALANVISGNTNNGVWFQNSGTTGNVVLGNFIGTNGVGLQAVANNIGVNITGSATGNTIGGSTAGARNVISGNRELGLVIDDTGTTSNLVVGNLIGTSLSGDLAVANTGYGVVLYDGASGNTIGGTTASAANVISGNTTDGIILSGTAGAPDNLIIGNKIGTNIAGTMALPNYFGVVVASTVVGTTIGGAVAGAGNLVSGNTDDGIQVSGSDNLVEGNMVGSDVTGTIAVPNALGVVVSGASNTIGGSVAGAGNLISGNTNVAMQISSFTAIDNIVEGNLIGTAKNGSGQIANGTGPGIVVEFAASANTIGGTSTVDENVISGNDNWGILLYGHGTDDNVVAGNLIGTTILGLPAGGESGPGVKIQGGAAANTIGGLAAGAGNVISGNFGDGVQIIDGYRDYVLGNRIGLDRSGSSVVSNSQYGVSLSQHFPARTTGGSLSTSGPGSHTGSNVIGGPGGGNVISGNGAGGIYVSAGILDVVAGNLIGTDASGAMGLGNGGNDGIQLIGGTGITIGGTAAGAANVISDNDSGILLSGSTGTLIEGNLIGTDITGTVALGNAISGVILVDAATNNTIGGLTAAAANLISGNTDNGISISGSGTMDNVVAGNKIGTNLAGTAALANGSSGVDVYPGATYNTIGGTVSGAGNLISGNGFDGVFLDGAGVSYNLVAGNLIGTDVTGTIAIPNQVSGIGLGFAATYNTVGGLTALARNVISGNQSYGVQITGASTNNVIEGNYIGTTEGGTAALGNDDYGIFTDGPSQNTIGGTAAGAGNLVSGNDQGGIEADDNSDLIAGNWIGTDYTGTLAIGNGDGDGLDLGGTGNTVGGLTAGAANVISGSTYSGMTISAGDNLVVGNLIGTTATGGGKLANEFYGLYILDGATGNTIGGTATGAGNVISGSGIDGLIVFADSTLIEGNKIGTDINGTVAIGNHDRGIYIQSAGNTIGGTVPVAGNLISGNNVGIELYQAGDEADNLIEGNVIGTTASGAMALGNSAGIQLYGTTATANTIGGTTLGAGNVIAGNTEDGIDEFGVGDLIAGNYIGTTPGSLTTVANGGIGVNVEGARNNTIGGIGGAGGNVISGNATYGIEIQGTGTTGNLVIGNKIGIDNFGTAVPNQRAGVFINTGPTDNTIGGTATGAGERDLGQ